MKQDLSKINLKPRTLEEACEVIGQLVEIIVEQKKEIDGLREQLNANSKNSSLPPSQDRKKKQKKAKSQLKKGAQPGHKGNQRPLVPPEKVTKFVVCELPRKHCDCGGEIKLKEKIERHQVFEIPVVKYEVIEYQLQKGCCINCSESYSADLPVGVSWKGFGPRVQSMTSLLTSKYRLSKRLVTTWFKDIYQMPVCLGSISNIEAIVSEALAPVHQDIAARIRSEKVVNADETGHKECNKNGWAWILSTIRYTLFELRRSRGKKVAKEIIGNFQDRVFITDRYLAYDYLPDKNRQICWAHLKRDFQKISEREDESGRVGRALLKCYKKVFSFWNNDYQEREVTRKKTKRLKRLKSEMMYWLKMGTHCSNSKTVNTCENLLDLFPSLWLFFEIPGVAPTNNHAERQLRPLVISKKLTFGTQSDRGSRYIERIFSTITTCKQQGRDALAFIIQAVQMYFRKESPMVLSAIN